MDPSLANKEYYDDLPNLNLEFPNLPYLIDGDFSMTECVPIMRYLCRKYKPEMLGDSIEEQSTVDMLANVAYIAYWDVIMIIYEKEDSVQEFLDVSYKRLKTVSEFVKDKKFLLGDKYTYVDIILYEHINAIKAFERDLKDEKFADVYPSLENLHQNVHNIKQIKEFVEGDRWKKLYFYNKYYLNNTI